MHPSWIRVSASFGLVALSFIAVGACSSSEDANPTNTPGVDAGIQNDGSSGDTPSPTDGGTPDGGGESEGGVTQVVGAAGGTLTAANGVKIEIPAGALPSDVTITVTEVPGAAPPPGATPLGPTFQFGPDGQTFAQPVKVTLPWSGGDVPVVIAHLPHGSTSWTTLTEGADHDATHVWGMTTSFSPFQAVFYQGSPDTPIVLSNDNRKMIEIGTTPELLLRGTGFRTDTVVTLFKDGVTTATVSPVKLTSYGLLFSVPAAFTDTLGLLTIEAKNPQAASGAATPLYVINKPALQSLSPSTVNIDERDDANYDNINVALSVTATDIPNDLSSCQVTITQSFGQGAALVADTTAPGKTDNGFVVTVTDWNVITGTSELVLHCGGVNSNKLPITFNLINKP